MGLPVRLNAKRQALFLAALGQSGSVRLACKASRISRSTAYDWRSSNTEFAAAWDQALDRGLDVLRDGLFHRLIYGTRRPIVSGGKIIAHVTEYDNRTALEVLARRRPDEFGERLKVDLAVDIAARMVAARQRRLKDVGRGEA